MLELKQPIAYKTIMNGIKKNRISHAYLFEGEKGTPKFELAIEFVKALFCENNIDEYLTNQICNRIDHGNYPNLHIIEADGSSIKKEQIQELQKDFSKTIIEGTKKIYIIKDADKMTTSAANSLLKFLEEPFENVHAILITDNMNRLLKTIISRCQIISFLPLNLNDSAKNYTHEFKETLVKIAILQTNSKEDMERLIRDEYLQKSIDQVVHFATELEKRQVETIVFLKELWHDNFSDKQQTLFGLDLLFYFYNDVMNYKFKHKIEIYNDYSKEIIELSNQVDTKILNNIESVLKARQKCESNVNTILLMEQLIMEMKGGK